MTTPEHNKRVSIARRMADKRKRDAARAALADIDPDYLAKLRHECLKAANATHPGADPSIIVEEAERHLRARLAFLRGEKSNG